MSEQRSLEQVFSELEMEDYMDRAFQILRIDVLRQFAAEGHAESAVRLRWELAERREDKVRDLRFDPGPMSLVREKYRQLGSRLRALVFRHYGRKCGICGRTDGFFFEIDHKVPYSRGGRHTFDNLWVLCKPCNQDKGARTVEEYMEVLEANRGQ